jgi:hypothetical protein
MAHFSLFFGKSLSNKTILLIFKCFKHYAKYTQFTFLNPLLLGSNICKVTDFLLELNILGDIESGNIEIEFYSLTHPKSRYKTITPRMSLKLQQGNGESQT